MRHRTRYCKQACMQAVMRVYLGCSCMCILGEEVYVGCEEVEGGWE